MLLKNSFRNVVRTPIKTALFILLLAAVTSFLCFGINMQLSVSQSLEAAGQAFATIGVVEYRDPNNSGIERHWYNYDFTPIINSKFVESFDQRLYLSGMSEEIVISKELSRSRSGYQYSVIEFTPVEIITEGKLYRGKIQKVLHSYDSSIKEGNTILIEIDSVTKYDLKIGKSYITSVYKGWDPNIPEIYCVNEFSIQLDLKGVGYTWERGEHFEEAVMEITGEGYLEKGAGLMWADIIQMYKNSIKTATVFTTNDLKSILIFHQGNAVVTMGRTFIQEDYREGSRVCIISDKMARSNGLELGDRLSFTFSKYSLMEIRDSIMSADSINHNNIVEVVSFEIVGLYKLVGSMSGAYGLYEDTVFIPQKSIQYWPEVYETGDNQVSFRLTTGRVEDFLEEMDQFELPGLNFIFYDQGYSRVRGTLDSMKNTAQLLTGICAAAGLGIVLLFSLLYVGRQKHSIAIMYSLGTSRGRALSFLLITVLLVAGLGVSIGGFAGSLLSNRVLEEVYSRNSEKIVLSTAYSEVYGEDEEIDFQIIAPERNIAPLASAGTVLVAAMLFSGIFTIRVLRAEPMQVLTSKEE